MGRTDADEKIEWSADDLSCRRTKRRLKGIGEADRPEMLFIFLRFEFTGSVHVRVRYFEAVNDESDSAHEVCDERFFIHIVRIPKRVAVQKYVPGNRLAVNGCKAMESEASPWLEKARVRVVHRRACVRSGPNQMGSKIIGNVPAEAHLPAQVDAGVSVAHGQTRMRDKVDTQPALVLQFQ